MTRSMLFLCTFVLVGIAGADVRAADLCAEPSFPIPAEIRAVQEKQAGGEALSQADDFLVKSYLRDRDRYVEVYEQAFACAGDYEASRTENDLTPEETAQIKQELLLLERKWGQYGVTEENLSTHEEFMDVPEGELVNVE